MTNLSRIVLRSLGGAALFACTLALVPDAAMAQDRTTVTGRVQPGIWIDPDGCMHWVADGGVEGYMEGRVNPHDGMPVCLNVNTCAVTNSDVLFHTDSARLTHSGRAQLEQFFRSAIAPLPTRSMDIPTAAPRMSTTCRSASAAPHPWRTSPGP